MWPHLRNLKPRPPWRGGLSWRPATRRARRSGNWPHGRARIGNGVRHLVRAGVAFRRAGLTDDQSEKVERLYVDGLTLAEIAVMYGLVASTVRSFLLGKASSLSAVDGVGPHGVRVMTVPARLMVRMMGVASTSRIGLSWPMRLVR
jgi:hypothetical protein